MLILHGTQKFRGRVPGAAPVEPDDRSSTVLGAWYAGLLRWRPEVALLVNEATLLPVLVPLAPSRTVLARLPEAVATVLAVHGVPEGLVDAERAGMAVVRVAPTANRSLVGMLTEFSFLADAHRDDFGNDLVGLAVRLAGTPCSPLYERQVSPDRELAALVAGLLGADRFSPGAVAAAPAQAVRAAGVRADTRDATAAGPFLG